MRARSACSASQLCSPVIRCSSLRATRGDGNESAFAWTSRRVVSGRPALPGHRDHLGVEVDADRAGSVLGQLSDRAATAAACVDHGSAGDVAGQLVGTRAQPNGHGLRVAGIEGRQQAGHASNRLT
nr:hypothetical protein [Trebonia sp.]